MSSVEPSGARKAETQRARSASDREKLAVAPRMQGASWPRRLEHICSAAASSTLGSESAAAPAEPSVYPNLPLDFVPRLSVVEIVASLAAGAGAAALYLAYELRVRSAAKPPPLALALGAASVVLVAVAGWMQGALRERQQQAAMLTPEQAADKDSIFEDVDGLIVHYKRRASASPKRAFACLHGFGANETSWAVGNAAQMLAQRLDAIVVAHDAPGFGLTHRSKRLADYSTERNGAIGVALLERSAASLGAAGGGESRGQRILIGHSLGGLAAACAAVEDPRPSALVLVAPAIIVAGALQAAAKSEAEAPQSRRRSPLTLPARLVRALAVATLSCLGDVVTILLSPLIVTLLRKVVRSYAFWQAGLRGSYADKSKVTRALIDPYRRPKVVRGFEAGLVRFLRSRSAPEGVVGAFRSAICQALAPERPRSQLDRLVASGIPVLIIHGENDALVPLSNSRRLAQALPNCRLEVIPQCGHSPQEEKPQRFVELVEKFVAELDNRAGASAEQSLAS